MQFFFLARVSTKQHCWKGSERFSISTAFCPRPTLVHVQSWTPRSHHRIAGKALSLFLLANSHSLCLSFCFSFASSQAAKNGCVKGSGKVTFLESAVNVGFSRLCFAFGVIEVLGVLHRHFAVYCSWRTEMKSVK